jgi:hypothetical protein
MKEKVGLSLQEELVTYSEAILLNNLIIRIILSSLLEHINWL